MAALKEVFQKYGADYETTMSRFLGSEQIYLKILAMLPRDENLQKLDQALQAGDYPAAFDAALSGGLRHRGASARQSAG